MLFGASTLPSSDQLRIAAGWRWSRIFNKRGDWSPGISLGVSTRHVQPLCQLCLLYR